MANINNVSFKVANAIKEAGYPQGQEEYAYRSNGETYIFEDMFDHISDYCCDAPTYVEVWLWLWREKKIHIETKEGWNNEVVAYVGNGEEARKFLRHDPEEAIIAAIEYLADNDLIK